VKRTSPMSLCVALATVLALPLPAKEAAKVADKEEQKDPHSADTWSGLTLRNLGPALTSGRIADLAVHPTDPGTWYIAVASGGVWKTTNAGTTWDAIFDGEGSYSIGCVTLDPQNPNVVWVGSGENNSQRSVGYGDGVYKSEDGGKSWTNMGLEDSQHIGMIRIDPRDSDVVYVAAQGPLWNDGGDRGLYKTTDGGKTWKAALTISPKTGVSEVYLDPRDPDTVYAVAYQRRRHVWTLINGGPESGIHKSTDAGATWKKLESGLPKEDMGKIGLAIAPSRPDTIYAVIESTNKAGGLFRSRDRGATWEKRGDYGSSSPQYYNELFVDPVNPERVYAMDTFLKVSNDGGKTFVNLGEKSKHVDNHVIWVDPADNDHYLVGCDGGLYESFDRGSNWRYFENLPLIQYYRLAVDNSRPFYYVYGGTQDNNSHGGPARSTNVNGVSNYDWFITQGGDGFWGAIDPVDPNIVYAEYQHGGLTRYDRKSGEGLSIQPLEGKGEPGLRWNWDSPLIISPHQHKRLYFAANKLFRSDDRGDSWKAVSPDLTRQVDRNQLKVMGRVWSVDAVAKNASTSFFGNIVALDESRRVEGLLYVGTDDGLVQVSEDGGANWRKIQTFTGVPDLTYVSDLQASKHDAAVVYAAFDNHKMGDFKPYVLRSGDRGKTWTSVAGDLPARGSVYSIAEDHVDPNLLFAGTEFGVYATTDGGKKWIRLKGGMPTIAVKDIAIQERENDLVLATFGRGFYILDDYTPLRHLKAESLTQVATLFPTKTALAYHEGSVIGGRGKGSQGETFYFAPNPPFGAVFTYYLKDGLKTKKKLRQEAEKKLAKDGKDTPYPTWDALRAEAAEEDPAILITVKTQDGQIVRRLTGSTESGVHRTAWDLRYPLSTPTNLTEPELDPWDSVPTGPMAAPGVYEVEIAQRVDGKLTTIAGPQRFEVQSLGLATLEAPDKQALLAFQAKTARLQRAVTGATSAMGDAETRLKLLKKALHDTPAADPALREQATALEARLRDIKIALSGDRLLAGENEATPSSISDRVSTIVGTQWSSSSAPTGTSQENYRIAAELFQIELAKLKTLIGTDLSALEAKAEAAGAPWTPGRLPEWTPE
jgi:photosystem II stability/assembly factor-like uncharacterized protein